VLQRVKCEKKEVDFLLNAFLTLGVIKTILIFAGIRVGNSVVMGPCEINKK